ELEPLTSREGSFVPKAMARSAVKMCPDRVKPRSTQMPRRRKQREESAFGTLTPAQQRAWLAFIRLRLRLTYEMNRQLQAETNLSLSDYDVLNALRYEPEGRTQVTALAI